VVEHARCVHQSEKQYVIRTEQYGKKKRIVLHHSGSSFKALKTRTEGKKGCTNS